MNIYWINLNPIRIKLTNENEARVNFTLDNFGNLGLVTPVTKDLMISEPLIQNTIFDEAASGRDQKNYWCMHIYTCEIDLYL